MSNNRSDNDTFLSRIFGLNSVYYNPLDNPSRSYYHDNSVDLEANVETTNLDSINLNNLNLLNSESESSEENDSDVDSLSSNNDPTDNLLLSEANPRSSHTIPYAPQGHPTQSINWDTTANKNNPINNKSIKFDLPKARSRIFNVKKSRSKFNIPPRERALYLWANIINMDEFLNDLYYYYQNKGMNNIILSKSIDLVILGFILWFTAFLNWGINYDYFKSWDQAMDEKIYLNDLIKSNYWGDIPLFVKFLLLGFVAYICLRIVQLYFDYKYKLKEIQNFYYQLINIKNDDELMTISWIKIIDKVMLLKDYNNLTSSTLLNDLNSKVRLNSHDIANRIMRKENYFIALINKDIINLDLKFGPLSLNNSNLLTKTLEWNLKLCIFNFIFNLNGQINNKVLKDFNRNQLSSELNKRFKMAAIINLILSPFLVTYFVLLYFFKYFNEYRLNPSSIVNLRQFTPYAEWKLREFNELPHFFNKRLKLSYNPSNIYINQFPSNFLLINIMYLVNFISGSITAILVIFGLLLEDENHNFWSFELTENKSVLFYISIFGTIFAISSNAASSNNVNIPSKLSSNEFNDYYDPEASIKYVSQFTHYLPKHWKGKLHTQEVKNEYCELFKLRILIILNEIFSILLTPFLLWFKISNYSSNIIDFFRDYSIHIDGLGYICYFSMFNFEEKEKNMLSQTRKSMSKKSRKTNRNISHDDDYDKDLEEDDDEYSINGFGNDDKMIKSYMYFLESYQPTQSLREKKNAVKNLVKLNNSVDPTKSLINSDFSDVMGTSEISVDKMGRSGVLGMLNQFYKQDINKP